MLTKGCWRLTTTGTTMSFPTVVISVTSSLTEAAPWSSTLPCPTSQNYRPKNAGNAANCKLPSTTSCTMIQLIRFGARNRVVTSGG